MTNCPVELVGYGVATLEKVLLSNRMGRLSVNDTCTSIIDDDDDDSVVSCSSFMWHERLEFDSRLKRLLTTISKTMIDPPPPLFCPHLMKTRDTGSRT